MTNPEIVTTVTTLATDAGETLIATAVGVLPVLIPVFAAFWGIRFALGKLKLNKTGKAA